MQIRLTAPELHAILRKHVIEKYRVAVDQSYSCEHISEAERKHFGPVSFLFDCTPMSPSKLTPETVDNKKDNEIKKS
jgi:hypothetical protein